MNRRRWGLRVMAAVVVVGVVASAVVWRRSGDAGPTDPLVDAYVAGLASPYISDEDAACLARATVEAIGATTLADATSVDATRANPVLVPSELGLTVRESQGDAYYTALSDCVDPRALFVPLMDLDAECVNRRLDDALLRELIVAWFTSAAEISPELDSALTDLYEGCSTEPSEGEPAHQAARIPRLHNIQAAEDTVSVVSYNVRGLLRETDQQFWVDADTTRFTEVVGDEVARREADFVLLQEICGSQAEAIASRSRVRGHDLYLIAVDGFPRTRGLGPQALTICEDVETQPRGPAPPGPPVPYGRAILAHQPSASPIKPPPGYPACKGLTRSECEPQCIQVTFPQRMRVCNLHVDSGTTALGHYFDSWMQSEPLILGGDFNTIPDVEPMPSLYTDMHEGAYTTVPTGRIIGVSAHPPWWHKRIDYIFADKLHFDERSDGAILRMACVGIRFCSDHKMLVGEFPLRESDDPFPIQIEPAEHGGTASAVYLAITDSHDDPRIASAEAAARSVGYEATSLDLGCDLGAAEALGRDPASFAAAVAVYFDNDADAATAQNAFQARGIPIAGRASVTTICLD